MNIKMLSCNQIEELKKIIRDKSKINGSCIEWTGNINAVGYPRIRFLKKAWAVHRLVKIFETGEIAKGLNVCHKCNNKKCINVDHLYIGTQMENIHDYISTEEYQKKLEEKRKLRIEKKEKYPSPDQEYLSIDEFAKLTNVHPNTIRRSIKKGKIHAFRIGEGKQGVYRISRSQIQILTMKEVELVINTLIDKKLDSKNDSILKLTS